MVDKDAANAMTSVLGANADLKPDEIDSVAESIQGADVLVAALGIPLKSTIVALKKGRKHGSWYRKFQNIAYTLLVKLNCDLFDVWRYSD